MVSAAGESALWYKDAVIYQMHVRTFRDANGDGIGDFRGLTEKLDYIQDLGVTAVWLLPFYPSPLKDDGYDIADYGSVNPSYGDLSDFKLFLREAHRRGLKVITELVLNHTSDQHAWFRRARQAPPGDPARDFYVWSDSKDRYRDARIIFQDFEPSNWTWDPIANAYFWHRFYSHQPDLNFDNPAVHQAMIQVLDFWLRLGVDGLRLDAVPYLYEREGTSCENLPETHQFLQKLREHVDRTFSDRMLLAEANQWPEDAVAYFGNGNECHMAFHFPLMPRLFMSVQLEDRYPVIDIMQQTPQIPESCQWTIFLRNHDELTLEMVTDEERDYMYRAYARDPQARINLGIRRRLAPLLENNRRRIELMNGLLFSLPGTPVVYYGDELGMGDNIYLGDRNGVRTPMQWNADRNSGFSSANPQRLCMPVITDPAFHYMSLNVENEQNDPHSLLWWMKRLIALRKDHRAFSRGSIEFLLPSNTKILAFTRTYEDETILVVANLSRFAQSAELDLSAYQGLSVVELFGQSKFPAITDRPYVLSLTSNSFYWFQLRKSSSTVPVPSPTDVATFSYVEDWTEVIDLRSNDAFEDVLSSYLKRQRWFGGRERTIQYIQIQDTVRVSDNRESPIELILIGVNYVDSESERYLIPLAHLSGEAADKIRIDAPGAILALTRTESATGAIVDGSQLPAFWQQLLQAIAKRRELPGKLGSVHSEKTTAFKKLRGGKEQSVDPALGKADQSNSSATFGDRLILKLFRHVDQGMNPELEISRFLTEQSPYPRIPDLAGYLEYRSSRGEILTLGVLQEYIPQAVPAWTYTLDELGRFFEYVGTRLQLAPPPVFPEGRSTPIELIDEPLPDHARESIGPYLHSAELLGKRTAEMHLALSRGGGDPRFAPEPFTPFYQRSLYQSMRNLTQHVMKLLRDKVSSLEGNTLATANRLLQNEEAVLKQLREVTAHKISAQRIRCHGDFHLGQVLYTGKDFTFIDFEGIPHRPISERRIKRSPLRDVAAMLRSFHYAAAVAFQKNTAVLVNKPEDAVTYAAWIHYWYVWTAATFLRSYLTVSTEASYMPKTSSEVRFLLAAYTIEKAFVELEVELTHRPDWAIVPLRGLLEAAGLHQQQE
ncbi:MAG: maltose alpha-D-glucosyltransferase [Bdellovibrionota bacterium]